MCLSPLHPAPPRKRPSGLAGAGSLTIVYPLDYARTRLASDVGSGNPQFSGLFDCLTKTMAQGGFFSMYNGFGAPLVMARGQG